MTDDAKKPRFFRFFEKIDSEHIFFIFSLIVFTHTDWSDYCELLMKIN